MNATALPIKTWTNEQTRTIWNTFVHAYAHANLFGCWHFVGKSRFSAFYLLHDFFWHRLLLLSCVCQRVYINACGLNFTETFSLWVCVDQVSLKHCWTLFKNHSSKQLNNGMQTHILAYTVTLTHALMKCELLILIAKC